MSRAIDLHSHESCMHVAVRVLHSCAFISICYLLLVPEIVAASVQAGVGCTGDGNKFTWRK